MTHKNRNRRMRAMTLYVIPAAFVLLCSFAPALPQSLPGGHMTMSAATPDELPDSIATFPGGTVKMMEWMAANIRYPKIARDNHIEGRVTAKLRISETGKVTLTGATFKEIEPKEHKGCDDATYTQATSAMIREVEKLVKKMPSWNPATKDGKPMAMDMTLPIRFNL